MKFGLNVVPVRPDSLADIAVTAEELGFESLWVGEHVVTPVALKSPYTDGSMKPPFAPNSRFLEPFSTLAYLAALTTRVRLATGVLILPLRTPVQAARAIATVDVLSGGRLSLAIGVGWMREDFEVEGLSFEDRGRRTDEMITIFDRLFSEEFPSFSGDFYELPEMGFEPKPVQTPRPPLLIGGTSPAAIRRSARSGDGWYGGAQSPDELAALLAEVHRQRVELGRDQLPFEVTLLAGWAQTYDTDYVQAYGAAGVDRIVYTPWERASLARSAIETFAADAGLTAPGEEQS